MDWESNGGFCVFDYFSRGNPLLPLLRLSASTKFRSNLYKYLIMMMMIIFSTASCLNH